MLRRILPTLLILLCVVLDTAVLPIVYGGLYAVPLTLVAVFLIGMLLGRMRGLLYGTIGGLLVDITTGTLGMMMLAYMFCGFMIGLIVYQPEEQYVSAARRRASRRRWVWPAIWTFALYGVVEVALLVLQYFYTAHFLWQYLLYILIRAVVCTALVVLLRPLFGAMLLSRRTSSARVREVKNF